MKLTKIIMAGAFAAYLATAVSTPASATTAKVQGVRQTGALTVKASPKSLSVPKADSDSRTERESS
jgi:hypothetical protein